MNAMRKTLLALALPAAAAVQAGVEGEYALGQGQTMVVKVQDARNVRLEIPGGQGYQLVADGELFMVIDQGGTPMIMSAESFAKHMERFGQGGAGQLQQAAPEDVSVEDTGRDETVAGIDGDVYRISVTGADGGTQTTEVVLTDDERVRLLQQGFLAVMRSSAAMMQGNAGADMQLLETIGEETGARGVLRVEGMTLRSVTRKDFPAGTFTLPENGRRMDMGGR